MCISVKIICLLAFDGRPGETLLDDVLCPGDWHLETVYFIKAHFVFINVQVGGAVGSWHGRWKTCRTRVGWFLNQSAWCTGSGGGLRPTVVQEYVERLTHAERAREGKRSTQFSPAFLFHGGASFGWSFASSDYSEQRRRVGLVCCIEET